MTEENIQKEDIKDTDALKQKESSNSEANKATSSTKEDQKKDTKEQEENEAKSDAEKLDEAEKQITLLKDQLLRQMAEFDNYRKRTIKEKSDLILNGGQKVLESLLPVLDDLERAQANMEKSEDIKTLKEGVDLIINKLIKTLSSHGLAKIDTKDTAFDTDYHEAIALVPVEDEKKKNQIIDCVQTGYTLNGKVIRHAKVAVGQ